MESYQNAGWVACIDQVGSCLVPNMFEKLTPKRSSPHRVSWNYTIKKIQPLGLQALVQCNYPGQNLSQLNVFLSDCFSTGQPRYMNWFEALGEGKEKRETRCRRNMLKSNCAYLAIFPMPQMTFCHKFSYKFCSASSPLHSSFHVRLPAIENKFTTWNLKRVVSEDKHGFC